MTKSFPVPWYFRASVSPIATIPSAPPRSTSRHPLPPRTTGSAGRDGTRRAVGARAPSSACSSAATASSRASSPARCRANSAYPMAWLAVSHPLRPRAARRSDLVDEARRRTASHAVLDPLREDRSRDPDPDGAQTVGRVPVPRTREAREGAPGDARPPRGPGRCAGRCPARSFRPPPGRARSSRRCIPRAPTWTASRSSDAAYLRVRRRELQVVDDRAQVQPRAADEEHGAAAGADLGDGRARELLVARDGERLARFGDVDQMVRNARPLLAGGLRGPDVHPSVDGASSRRRRSPRPGVRRPRATPRSSPRRSVRRARAAGARPPRRPRRSSADRDGGLGPARPSGGGGGRTTIRASTKLPGAIASDTRTTRFVRVRPCVPPLRPVPSTSTSTVRPTCRRICSSPIDSWTSTSRSNRSWTTSLGTCSSMPAARVPGRGEYWNV